MRTLLTIVLFAGALFTISTIVIGVKTFEGTVVNDAYTEGLRWDDSIRARRSSGWSTIVMTKEPPLGRSDFRVRVVDHDGHRLTAASVELTFSRPETSRYDHTTSARETDQGWFSATADFPKAGRWQVTVTVTQANKTVTFDEMISVTDAR